MQPMSFNMEACHQPGVAMSGRNSASPRALGQRLVRWFVGARSHRVICFVCGVWLLNAFDLILTIMAHNQGILTEENPIARLFLQDGVASIILFKVGFVCLGSYPLLRFRQARIVELGALVVLVAYALVAVRWHRCYDLYLATPEYSDPPAMMLTAEGPLLDP